MFPAAAVAQPGNPLSPGLPQEQPSIPTTTAPPVVAPTTTTTPGASGLSAGSAFAIGIGAIVILAGISFFIWRDARRRAPVRQRALAATAGGARAGSKPKPKPRKLSPAERRRRKRGRAR
jgi:hypothetical protein